MRVLAVDPGTKRVGVAVSDPTGTIAQPLLTLSAEPRHTLARRLAGIAAERDAERIVVGLPRRLDGRYGPEAKEARSLGDELRRESGLPVEMIDERLTTAQAEKAMVGGGVRRERRKASIDQVAATLLLQSHLDRNHGRA